MQKFTFIILFMLCKLFVGAQQAVIGGTVYCIENEKKQPLPSALVKSSTTYTLTNEQGKFILNVDSFPVVLIVSFAGFLSDTFTLNKPTTELEVILEQYRELKEAEITADELTALHSIRKPINTEILNQGELKKAACCNLAESFESNASVDVSYTDAVTGARTIQMLGLSGIYTQMLTENTPVTRVLSANYGLSFIPGTWIESIQISKGVGSVVNGYESMAGQINIEFLKPENYKADKIFLNLYTNAMGRSEANLHLGKKLNDKVSSYLFMHGSGFYQKNDHNHDNFLDNPLGKQINITNRWKIQNKKTEQVIIIRALHDEKHGGELNFNPTTDKFTTNAYGTLVKTRLAEAIVKNGFLFPSSATKSAGIIAAAKYHQQNSFFGLRTFDALQKSVYVNAIFQDIIGNSFHQYKTGVSYQFDEVTENVNFTNQSLYTRTESVPGVFFEYNYSPKDKFTMLAGIRADYHNLYGLKYTPRLHFRYQVFKNTTLRASAGTGFRTANIFAENSAVFVSSRNVYREPGLKPEESINAGMSILQKLKLFSREATLNIDFYKTDFLNQMVVDLDKNPQEIWFYNLNGKSYSNSFQIDFEFEPVKNLLIKTAYKNYRVFTNYHGNLWQRPFIPQDRIMFNFSWQTVNKIWKFDFISNWFGKSRIPHTGSNPDDFRFAAYSKTYTLVHIQITKLFKWFELYAGVENILNFTQHDAILAYNDPFGSYFDASLIWGPLNGRNFYAGLRWSLK